MLGRVDRKNVLVVPPAARRRHKGRRPRHVNGRVSGRGEGENSAKPAPPVYPSSTGVLAPAIEPAAAAAAAESSNLFINGRDTACVQPGSCL